MRKPAVILVVLLLLGLCGTAQAADLQAGWYAKFGVVTLYGWHEGKYELVDWNFTGGLGTFGPFEVTQPNPIWPQRMVRVPSTVTSVPIGTSVYLLGEPARPIDYVIDTIVFTREADYDASQLRLELMVQHHNGSEEVVWYDTKSGPHTGSPQVFGDGRYLPAGDTIKFRMTAVPEPTSAAVLASGVVAILCGRGRRRN